VLWSEILSQHARKYGLPLIEAYRRRGLSERLFERWILEIVDYLAAETPLAEGFHCAIHGDFWHGNVLAAAEGTRITGILDWDRFEPQSLPFLDLLHLIAKYDEILQHIPWEESVVGLHKALDTESNDAEEVRDYATEIGVDKDLISRFVIVYWMRQCLLLLRDDVPQLNSFLHKEVDEPLNYFHNFIQCD
jgi:aminoglycoside phosphotransferase (APT) family kinase protein